MGRKRTGITTTCPVCHEPYYRPGHNIRNNTQKYCSVKCANVMRSGENNPFFGKKHSAETIARIASINRANPPKGTGPKKGIFKHTPEAKAKMSAALRERWRLKRMDMLAYTKGAGNSPHNAFNPLPRYKLIFNKDQKRDWMKTSCFYCGSTETLTLDHIIPIICGGKNVKHNAQTLCQPCNMWKLKYVDRPLYNALLVENRG